jgi:hypothetical protein
MRTPLVRPCHGDSLLSFDVRTVGQKGVCVILQIAKG